MAIDRFTKEECIFCLIVKGQSPAHIVAEDEEHLAFLNKYPNMEGSTVVITKAHYGSYFAEANEKVVAQLMRFSRKVSDQICRAYPQTSRCALIFEGYGVDHLHTKLFPLHHTNKKDFRIETPTTDRFFDKYPGYITTERSLKSTSDQDLAKIATKIRNCAN